MEKLRACEIFRDSRFQLIAVESIDFQLYKTDTLCQLSGNIEPIAVIVCSSGGTYALDMQAKPTAFDQLRKDIPELDAMIKPFDNV